MSDPLLRLLARLPDAEPDVDRAARLRARCRSMLNDRADSSTAQLANSPPRQRHPAAARPVLSPVAVRE